MTRITTPPPLPQRPTDGHKGLFGRVLVAGGSEAMIGAPVLAATAALRCGSGLVQLAVPKSILHACLAITPELIGVADKKDLMAAAEQADAIVIGPGLGAGERARKLVRKFLRIDKPVVIDADALNTIATQRAWPGDVRAKAVLTPHPGEMKRLAKFLDRDEVPSDDDGRIDIATAAAQAFGQIVLLKGHRTIVTDGQRVYVNQSGDSSLSKAGSGDVLCGVIASLIGQGMDLFNGACAGAFIHGRAGELAGAKLGMRSALARDVIDALPTILREISPTP